MAARRIPPADLATAAADSPGKLNALIDAKVAEIKKELAGGDTGRPAGAANFPIAHLTGTAAFDLTDAQRQDLKNMLGGRHVDHRRRRGVDAIHRIRRENAAGYICAPMPGRSMRLCNQIPDLPAALSLHRRNPLAEFCGCD